MKSLSQFINEARRNPHLNPKVSVNQEIKNHLDYARRLPNTNSMNSFVSFTSIDKLGINPGSTYDTPLGIYAYPSQYVIEKTGKDREMSSLPFAGTAPYVNVFSVKGKFVDLSSMNDSDLRKYYKKITDVYLDAAGTSGRTGEIERIINDASSKAKFSQHLGGRFWYVTMKATDLLMETSREWGRNKHSVAWNKLFREIGIDGCIDMGIGIIHTAEPTQAVFFSKKVIKKNRRVYNKYSPEYIKRRKEEGKMLSSFFWNGGIWYGDSDWEGGTWKRGTWVNGRWWNGLWKRGTWKRGTWVKGTWEDGTWENGTWVKGTWKDGTWKDGTWEDGTWEDGVWEDGTWKSGKWKDGTWKGGTFKGVWFDGTWESGVWKSGIWLDGTWENGEWGGGSWRGGTWENGIWKKGVWEDGTWEDGIWEKGGWLGGTWKGGTWMRGTWKGGTWLGGIWKGGYDEYRNYHPEGDSPDKW